MPLRYNDDQTLTDGIYDDQKTHCREKFVQGKLTHTISHTWIHSEDEESLNRLEEWMKPPFGHDPDVPPQLKMKK
jgi:hypothetical protein